MKQEIKGEWVIKTISIEGTDARVKATVFNEADFNCFIGSTWNFIANNSLGTYMLPNNAAGCSSITRNIRWSIDEPEGDERKFQFKRLDDKKNPVDDNNGFRLSVATLTETSMQLKSALTFEGKPINIVYNFEKNK